MITESAFREMALSFPGTVERPHFERAGFKVAGRRMFATYLPADHTANVFLTPEEQALFCSRDPQHIYPVPNKWGAQGATTFVLDRVNREWLQEALISAYQAAMKTTPKKSR